MAAYYNEHDPKVAAWLRELIKAGLIADGDVDERSIVDVRPGDVRGFRQCHFFAGIGGWSYALRLAGWPDDRAVWTGSCPCQPFSAAGKGRGKEDARHLWPQFRRLIRQCRPATVFGEQVASKAGRVWLSSVFADAEALGYRTAGADLCAAGVGAPHIRQRLYFVLADNASDGCRQRRALRGWRGEGTRTAKERRGFEQRFNVGELADSGCERCHGQPICLCVGEPRSPISETAGRGEVGDVGNAYSAGCGVSGRRGLVGSDAGVYRDCAGAPGELAYSMCATGERRAGGVSGTETAIGGSRIVNGDFVDGSANGGEVGGFWSDCDWIPCKDGKLRPVEPDSFPLAHGIPARVGRLRGYGNAIVPQVAAAFVGAYCEVNP